MQIRNLATNEICLRWRNQNVVVVGKDAACDIVIEDRGVSRRHFEIRQYKNRFEIQDLKSTNGTWVNGNRISVDNENPWVSLHDGDQIVLGQVVLRWEFDPNKTEIVPPPMDFPPDSTSTAPTACEQEDFLCQLPCDFLDFRIHKKVGSGGMAEVYLATSNRYPGIPLAIKFLHRMSSEKSLDRARFLREIEITQSLRHPCLMHAMEFGDERERLFLVMEYCDGGSLSEVLKRSSPLRIHRVIGLFDKILSGVSAAHQSGIVHRDLKPSNVLLQRNKYGRLDVRVSDFGLAKSYLHAGQSNLTINGTIGGSWDYMPVEQITNFRFVSPSSDIWSLGAILFHCLAGHPPRTISTLSDPVQAILQRPEISYSNIRPDTPRELIDIVQRALSHEISDRFKDATAMLAEIRKVTC